MLLHSSLRSSFPFTSDPLNLKNHRHSYCSSHLSPLISNRLVTRSTLTLLPSCWFYCLICQWILRSRNYPSRTLYVKAILKNLQNSRKNTNSRRMQILNKEFLSQVSSCEFWESFQNGFFIEHFRATTSNLRKKIQIFLSIHFSESN